VSRAELERQVLEVFRETALAGSQREVALDVPLGEAGLGLDSLALVSFVTRLERRFAVRFSDELWSERGQVSLRLLAARIEGERAAAAPGRAPAVANAPAGASGPAGPPGITREIVRRLAGRAFGRGRYLLLARDLEEGPIPAPESFTRLPLAFRAVTPEELATLPRSWPQFRRRLPLEAWRAEMAAGATCLAAFWEGRIAALEWLSGDGESRSSMGLPIRVRPGTSYGFRLLERLDAAGNGIGLSLLAFSLAESRRRGYARQAGYVDERNRRMLVASLVLLGFKSFGEVRVTRLFGASRARWRVDGREGTGGTLVL
jgi:acyl carrier protein